jgi:peroxiredoxin
VTALALALFAGVLAAPSVLPVTTTDGVIVDLRTHFAGRAAVVIVMKSGSCEVCLAQLRTLSKRRSDIAAIGAVIAGLNTSSSTMNQRLQRDLNLEILRDPTGETLRSIRLWVPRIAAPLPGVVFINRCGEIEAVMSGRGPGHDDTQTILTTLKQYAAQTVCGVVI